MSYYLSIFDSSIPTGNSISVEKCILKLDEIQFFRNPQPTINAIHLESHNELCKYYARRAKNSLELDLEER